MVHNEIFNYSSTLSFKHFTVFPEYFISISAIYVLVVIVLITYNVYGLMLQKAISQCLVLILAMACYLIINDDLIIQNNVTFQSSIVNDHFTFYTKIIVCTSSAVYFIIIGDSLKEQKLTSFEYLFITLFAVLGLILLCSSYDLLTAYLAIELSSFSFYLLACFRKTSSYSIESGIKYFIIGSTSSAFFLLGSSFLYGCTGSICLEDYHRFFQVTFMNYKEYTASLFLWYAYIDDPSFRINPVIILGDYPWWFDFSMIELGITLILFSLFIKLALAPFHLWSLDVYEGSPTSSTFFFAVISKLSIFVFLVRISRESLFIISLADSFQFYSMWVAVLSIFVGAFGGLRQRKLKTLLAYSSTSHMGYALLSFSTFTVLGNLMLFFYLILYIAAGLCTWGILLSLRLKTSKITNKCSKELGDLVLLNKSNPSLAFAFALTMFSIAGIPPMAGFLAKLSIFFPLINVSSYFIALIAILLSVISTFYYIRIIKILYFENILAGKLYYPITTNNAFIISWLTFLLVFFFINPNLLYLAVYKISMQNYPADPDIYIIYDIINSVVYSAY
jgi:NADH-quinone oxidoreductase subunit N